MSALRYTFRSRIETTALLAGLALIAACESPSHVGGDTPTDPVSVDSTAVASVTIAPDTLTLLATGGHRMVQATARNGAGAPLPGRWTTWTSSDVTVATVDASGNVSAHQPGRAWITASVDGREARARVDVVPVTVDSIALDARAIEVQWGTVRTLGATLHAADGRILYDRDVAWSSSDSGVAVVDAQGRIRAVAGGSAWITATSEGRTARAEVVVPLVKVMRLRAADGGALPRLVQDTVVDEGEGRRRRVRVEVVSGTLSLHSRQSTYEQRVVTRTFERRGTCAEWGSCIWETTEEAREHDWTDQGDIQLNLYTGEPIFVSRRAAGLVYHAQNAPADGFTVWQGVPGTALRLPFLYAL